MLRGTDVSTSRANMQSSGSDYLSIYIYLYLSLQEKYASLHCTVINSSIRRLSLDKIVLVQFKIVLSLVA